MNKFSTEKGYSVIMFIEERVEYAKTLVGLEVKKKSENNFQADQPSSSS